MLSVVLDSIVIIIVAINVIIGIKRGFVKSVMGMVAVVLALICAWNFAPLLAEPINEKYVHDYTVERVEKTLVAKDGNTGKIKFVNAFEKLPEPVRNFLSKHDVSVEEVMDRYDNAKKETDTERRIAEYIADPIERLISKIIAFAILFVAVLIILYVLLFIIDKVCLLPGLHIMNKGLGVIMGLIKGALFAVAVSFVLCHLFPYFSLLTDKISSDMIEDTIIVKYLGNLDFFTLI